MGKLATVLLIAILTGSSLTVVKAVSASTSDYTIITFLLGPEDWSIKDGQIDFQVKAKVGYFYPYVETLLQIGMKFKNLEESGWSSTQTVTVGNPKPTSTAGMGNGIPFSFDWEKTVLIILVVVIAVMAVGMVSLWRRIPAKSRKS